MKKVLVVSYHFPPSGGARTRRTLKFLKYWAQLQWQSVVLTAKHAEYIGFDPSLLAQIPKDVVIYRAPDLSSHVREVLDSAATIGTKQRSSEVPAGRVDGFKMRGGVAVTFLKKWIAIPDPLVVCWVPFAILKGLVVCRRQQIDLIYATAPPFSTHIVAIFLKLLTRKPLVIDFRDAWIANPMRTLRLPQSRRAVEAQVERAVVHLADLVMATTDGMIQDFRMRYPQEPEPKFALVTNGYDRDDAESVAAPQAAAACPKLRLVHTGNLTAERSPRYFLESVRLLLDGRPDLVDRLEVIFVGQCDRFMDGCLIEDYLGRYDLHSVVKLPGYVSRREAMEYQGRADILLLFIGVVPKEHIVTYGIASKLYDYMLVRKPIMALTDPGPVSEIVERTNMGVVLGPSDVEGMKTYLSDAFDRHTQDRLCVYPTQSEINKYDVQTLSEHVVGLFEACLRV